MEFLFPVIVLVAALCGIVTGIARRPVIELHSWPKGDHWEVTSPQVPGVLCWGPSEVAALGLFVRMHDEKLDIRVVTRTANEYTRIF